MIWKLPGVSDSTPERPYPMFGLPEITEVVQSAGEVVFDFEGQSSNRPTAIK